MAGEAGEADRLRKLTKRWCEEVNKPRCSERRAACRACGGVCRKCAGSAKGEGTVTYGYTVTKIPKPTPGGAPPTRYYARSTLSSSRDGFSLLYRCLQYTILRICNSPITPITFDLCTYIRTPVRLRFASYNKIVVQTYLDSPAAATSPPSPLITPWIFPWPSRKWVKAFRKPEALRAAMPDRTETLLKK